MCCKIVLTLIFSLALSSALWSDPVSQLPGSSFSEELSEALAPAVDALSPEQAQLWIPVLELYDSRLTTLVDRLKTSEAATDQLSSDLGTERQARQQQATREFWQGVGLGAATGGIGGVLLIVLLAHH